MKPLFRLLALLALALVIVPPFALLMGWLGDESRMKMLMLAGTILWFVAAPFWLRSKPDSAGS
jgi:hypothetical protein